VDSKICGGFGRKGVTWLVAEDGSNRPLEEKSLKLKV
jgi:hypothetical protein